MGSKIVSIDFDEVLVDSGIIESVLSERGLAARPHDYGLSNFPEDIKQEILRRFRDPNHNTNPRLLPGACEAVSKIVELGFRVIIVTARSDEVKAVTLDTVSRHFSSVCDVYFTSGGSKGEVLQQVGAVMHVDDHFRHVEDAINSGVSHGVLVSNELTSWNHQAAAKYQKNRIISVLDSVAQVPGLLTRL